MFGKILRKGNVFFSAASMFLKRTDPEMVADILGRLKGPAMKLGQLLSSVPGLLREDFQEAFKKLQQFAPKMGENFVRQRMSEELGSNWESLFDEFSLVPDFAASIGQVHKAKIGSYVVACKLQYPNMERITESDCEQLFFLLRLVSNFKKPLILDSVFEELKEKLKNECDYFLEAQNIREFAQIFKNDPSVIIPDVVDSYSTKKLLTMQFVESRNLNDCIVDCLNTRKNMASQIFKAWYLPFYKHGFIHADPHFGNYGFSQDSIVLYDFGCVRRFEPDFIKGVLLLREALLENNDEKAREAYFLWGFQEDLTYEMFQLLNRWAHFVYFPIINDEEILLSKNYVSSAKAILKDLFFKADELGGIRLPKPFLLFDRATIGVGSAFIRLNVPVNYYKMFDQLVSDFL